MLRLEEGKKTASSFMANKVSNIEGRLREGGREEGERKRRREIKRSREREGGRERGREGERKREREWGRERWREMEGKNVLFSWYNNSIITWSLH